MSAHLSSEGSFTGIRQYCAGKSAFITGATGFIGKVIVEKLLRACPEIKFLYILIRPKKGFECQERIDKIIKLPVSNFENFSFSVLIFRTSLVKCLFYCRLNTCFISPDVSCFFYNIMMHRACKEFKFESTAYPFSFSSVHQLIVFNQVAREVFRFFPHFNEGYI